ncbi:MAG: ATP-dependent metallopeptidase FtsH/Yme1/Tma family protein [Acidiferrobacterales bacterium]
MEKKTQFNVCYIILALFVILLFQNWWAASRQIEVIQYSQFEELLEAGKIEEVYVRQNRLKGMLNEPSADGR